jgi:hypothetical protein
MAAMSGRQTIWAILTDVQFWVPMLVLLGGVVLLVLLH